MTIVPFHDQQKSGHMHKTPKHIAKFELEPWKIEISGSIFVEISHLFSSVWFGFLGFDHLPLRLTDFNESMLIDLDKNYIP